MIACHEDDVYPSWAMDKHPTLLHSLHHELKHKPKEHSVGTQLAAAA